MTGSLPRCLALLLAVTLLAGLVGCWRPPVAVAADSLAAYLEEEAPAPELADPLEPVNRFFFNVNDRVYFLLLKPAGRLWSAVLPRELRLCVRNFLKNLLFPVRFVNACLQGKLDVAGLEFSRFAYNTTVGVGGLADAAATDLGLRGRDEDLGQTLGRYGMGPGWYICWPLLGPSTVRDTLGLVGDMFLDPVAYLDWGAAAAVKAGGEVNRTSLHPGEYEDFKAAALDPYVSLRRAYQQYRQAQVEDRDRGGDGPLDRQEAGAGSGFAVSLAVTVDRQRAEAVAARLRQEGETAAVVTYHRDDYEFYGVRTEPMPSFRAAKTQELRLVAAGFPEARVVRL